MSLPMGLEVPETMFYFREGGVWIEKTSHELFAKKKVVIFGLPGAFTPTCSEKQLPGYENLYPEFLATGVDEVYCVSVNDAFVMNAWAETQGIRYVKMLPDGNATFTALMNQLVIKNNLGFGLRSWRYACVVNNLTVEFIAEEEGKEDNHPEDPYEKSTPENILEYLKSTYQA